MPDVVGTLTKGGTAVSLLGHGAADHLDITRYLWLDRDSTPTADAGVASKVGVEPDAATAWLLADAATQGMYGQFGMPADAKAATAINATIFWSPQGAVTGAVRWSLDALAFGAGNDVRAAGTTTAFTGSSAARTVGTIVAEATTQILASTNAGDIIRFNVRRIGADAADTYASGVLVVMIRIDYTATQ